MVWVVVVVDWWYLNEDTRLTVVKKPLFPLYSFR